MRSSSGPYVGSLASELFPSEDELDDSGPAGALPARWPDREAEAWPLALRVLELVREGVLVGPLGPSCTGVRRRDEVVAEGLRLLVPGTWTGSGAAMQLSPRASLLQLLLTFCNMLVKYIA